MASTWLDNFGEEMGAAAWLSKFEEETIRYFHKPDGMAEKLPPFREDQVDWLWDAVSQTVLHFGRKVNKRFVEAEQRATALEFYNVDFENQLELAKEDLVNGYGDNEEFREALAEWRQKMEAKNQDFRNALAEWRQKVEANVQQFRECGWVEATVQHKMSSLQIQHGALLNHIKDTNKKLEAAEEKIWKTNAEMEKLQEKIGEVANSVRPETAELTSPVDWGAGGRSSMEKKHSNLLNHIKDTNKRLGFAEERIDEVVEAIEKAETNFKEKLKFSQ